MTENTQNKDAEPIEDKQILHESTERIYPRAESSVTAKTIDYNSPGYREYKLGILQEKQVKLSIDNLVDLYLKGKLKYDAKDKKLGKWTMQNNDCFVDADNPIVSMVLSKLENMSYQVRETYNPRIIEDHIDNVIHTAKEVGYALYFISIVGIIHHYINEFRGQKSPFENSDMFLGTKQTLDKTKEAILNRISEGNYGEWLKDRAKKAGGFALGMILSPILAFKFVAELCYEQSKKTIAAMHPARFPGYALELKSLGTDFLAGLAEKQQREKPKNLLNSIAYTLGVWYHESGIFDLFGYEQRKVQSFDGLTRDKLKNITQTISAGYAYVVFMDLLISTEKIISDATNTKQNKIMFFDNKDASNIDDGYELDKKDLHVDIKSNWEIIDRIADCCMSDVPRTKISSVAYYVLDELLHQKVHQGESDYCGRNAPLSHRYNFWEEKTNLAEKVMEYMKKHNISIEKTAEEAFEKYKGYDKFKFMIMPNELKDCTAMTKPRLAAEGRCNRSQLARFKEAELKREYEYATWNPNKNLSDSIIDYVIMAVGLPEATKVKEKTD